MIFRFNYEELRALRHGARSLLGECEGGHTGAVAAPTVARARVEALLPRLTGDVEVTTLADQRKIEVAVEAIVVYLRSGLDQVVVETHPADEHAVNAYFDFAHTLTVLQRVRDAGSEMKALIEVVTGEAVNDEVAETFVFPD